jgi:hypothetical protein
MPLVFSTHHQEITQKKTQKVHILAKANKEEISKAKENGNEIGMELNDYTTDFKGSYCISSPTVTFC